ncbi:unnamed protein product [Symbiodinium microadriaticum]|nr:unnamed protein product [Symbiodinium microadriaticum]
MYTTDAFAFYLLSLLTSPDLTPRKAGEVVIDRLAFDDVSPQLVIVAGCHPDWSRIVATSRGVQESVQEEQAAEPGGAIGGDDGDGRPPAVEEGNADGNAANVFDFMSFLSDPNEASAAAFGSSPPPRAKRRKTENGRGPAGNSTDTNNPDVQHEFEGQPAHETDFLDILDDPELYSVLDDNAIQALKQAAAMCRHIHRPEEALQAAQAQHSLESDDDEVLEFAGENAAEAGDDGGSLAASATTSSSSAVQRGSRRLAADAGWSTDSIKLESDGGRIEAVYTGQRTSYCKVIRRLNNTIEELGQIYLLVNSSTGAESLRAVCKKHKGCTCFVSNTGHPDLLIGWLASAHLESAEKHGHLSAELRQSIGMKVKGCIRCGRGLSPVAYLIVCSLQFRWSIVA